MFDSVHDSLRVLLESVLGVEERLYCLTVSFSIDAVNLLQVHTVPTPDDAVCPPHILDGGGLMLFHFA